MPLPLAAAAAAGGGASAAGAGAAAGGASAGAGGILGSAALRSFGASALRTGATHYAAHKMAGAAQPQGQGQGRGHHRLRQAGYAAAIMSGNNLAQSANAGYQSLVQPRQFGG